MPPLVESIIIKISDLKMAGAGMAVGKAFTGLTGLKVAKVSAVKKEYVQNLPVIFKPVIVFPIEG